jgi:pimeloyl-ACP methyl ester carboxylesterase
MRWVAIAAAALLGVALLGYALGLGIYAVASAKTGIPTEPRTAEEADAILGRLGLAKQYPFPHRFALTPHGRMHYVDEGSGPVTLCLHGNASWSLECAELLHGRAPGARVLAPDLVGFGLSEKPDAQPRYTVDAHAADLAALLVVLDVRDVQVVAPPSTAAVAEALAKLAPQRVRGVTNAADPPPAGPAPLRLVQAPLVGELLVQGFGALAPGGPHGPYGRLQSNWDERASSLALARATGS